MVTQLVAGGVDWRTVSGPSRSCRRPHDPRHHAHFQVAQDRQAAEFMDRLLVAAAQIPAEEYAGGAGYGRTSINA